MKVFFVSSIIFTIIFAFVLYNSAFTARFYDEMTSLCDSLPKEKSEFGKAEKALLKLKAYFESKETIIMITNNHSKVHEVYKLLSQAEAAIKADDFSQYIQARLTLYDAIKTLSEFNRISFVEIF